MAGIYIHIPFCRQKCSYCNFHFSTDMRLRKSMAEAICKELEMRKDEVTDEVETVYFGGGTPSLLEPKELDKIFDSVYRNYSVSKDAEVTLEANPDDLDKNRVNYLKTTPTNRFSIGIQSFFEEDLKFMNRAHDSIQAETSVRNAQDAGFENITIDLIYGSQTTTDEMWQSNINKALELEVPHISAYVLTIEPKTLLYHQVKVGKIEDVDDLKQDRQFRMLIKSLSEAGFIHYEISNFGKEGYMSKHNSSYWRGVPYLGIGPSAHSYDGKNRSWNIDNNHIYVREIKKGILPSEKEILTAEDRFNELVMIKLRMIDGIPIDKIEKDFPTEFMEDLLRDIEPYLKNGMIIKEGNRFKLTEKGMFLADGIASDLFRI